MQCLECKEKEDVVLIPVYKRDWIFCNVCGSATSWKEKNNKILSLLPYDFLKRKHNEENIYDYFETPEHQEVSKNNYEAFCSLFLKHLIGLETKNIIDISGGSGHFLKLFKAKYALLTEINDKAINFAKRHLHLNAIKFNFNHQKIDELINMHEGEKKFDLVFLNACTMFCKDLEGFMHSLKQILNEDAIIIVHANVQPTVGVVVRTQFDDHSYLVLRQKQRLRRYFENHFTLLEEARYEDLYPQYVTSHDLNPLTRLLKIFYTEKAITKLIQNKKSIPSFRYKDRHVFYQVYKFNSEV